MSNFALSPSSTPLLHRSCDDMSLRQSFSRFRKKAKDKLSPIFGKTKRRGPNVGGEESIHPTLSLQSEPAITAGGELGEDTRASFRTDDPRRDDSLSVSRSAVEIGHDKGEEDKASGGEASKKYLHPHSRVQAESRSSQERKDVDEKRTGRVDPPLRPESDIGERTPAPSISRGSGSEST